MVVPISCPCNYFNHSADIQAKPLAGILMCILVQAGLIVKFVDQSGRISGFPMGHLSTAGSVVCMGCLCHFIVA